MSPSKLGHQGACSNKDTPKIFIAFILRLSNTSEISIIYINIFIVKLFLETIFQWLLEVCVADP